MEVPMTYTQAGLPRNFVLFLRVDQHDKKLATRYFHETEALKDAHVWNQYVGLEARVERQP